MSRLGIDTITSHSPKQILYQATGASKNCKCHKNSNFVTNRSVHTVQTQISSLIRVYMVCHFVSIFSTHCFIENQHCSNFRIRPVIKNFLFAVIPLTQKNCPYSKQVVQRATIAHLSPMRQGQISFQKTYKWAMETRGPKSNSSKLLCLSWLPATLMMILSKWIS